MDIFSAIFDFITGLTGQQLALAIILWLVFGLVVAMRIGLFLAYGGGTLLINLSAKNIKVRDDIKRLGNNVFGRLAREYVTMSEKTGRVDALALAQMAVVQNRLLFFNFKSMAGFINALERAFPIFAILSILATTAEGEFVIMSAIIFLLIIVLAAVFDINAAKDRYTTQLAHVLTRDVGQFFPTDATAAIYTFGNDLTDYLSRQSGMYNDVLNKINTNFTDAISSNISVMTKSLDATLNAVSKQEALQSALANWSDALGKAAVIQAAGSNSAKKMDDAAANLAACVERLNGLAEAAVQRNAATDETLAFVRENQKALELSVNSFEIAMKQLTANLGDALGKIVQHHLDGSGSKIADEISDAIKAANAANAEQAHQIRAIFQEINEQSRTQTRLMLNIKEQLVNDE